MTLAIVVTGDRHAVPLEWKELIRKVLMDGFHQSEGRVIVISGKAQGIDSIVDEFVEANPDCFSGIPIRALWENLGDAAGPIRNARMIAILAELKANRYEVKTIGFHNNVESGKGTKDTLNKSFAKGFETWLYNSKGDVKLITKKIL